jgi:opacity protein-like surface antigen
VSVLEVLKVRMVLKVLVPRVPTVLKVLVLRVLVLGVLGVLMVPAESAAQDEPRGYIVGIGGMAYAVESDRNFAGLGAWRLNHRFELFGEIGWMRNVIGQDLTDALKITETKIRADNARQFGTEFPVDFEARVPAWYGFGGVRLSPWASAGKLSAFVEGGIGAARLRPEVHLTVNGDPLDSEAAALTGIDADTQQVGMMAGGGAGVAFQGWKRIRIEGGYRYMRLFGDARTNINRVHVGAGWTF